MIGIIGFGRFSELMAHYLSKDFTVRIATRRDQQQEIRAVGGTQVSLEDVCAMKVIILSVPISAMKGVLNKIAPLLNPEATVLDVCSVKEVPVRLMKTLLPESVSILPTHPMFGPDSAAESLAGKKIVLCRERIADGPYQAIKAYLGSKGLTVLETTATEHDRQTAKSLALTHFIGRALSAIQAGPLEIDTEGYKRLLHILEVVENDTWQLFLDMHTYNAHAKPARKAFMNAMENLHEQLEEAEKKKA
jgi:prephenate dehydrogenase